ncbi:MAG: flagellar hook-length control protein FliK [Candidatus Krumholzibacteriota bacterium]|nr:flagellar hook-length control protein FliK [Candidatus Krumholzibacteriota bacterium]
MDVLSGIASLAPGPVPERVERVPAQDGAPFAACLSAALGRGSAAPADPAGDDAGLAGIATDESAADIAENEGAGLAADVPTEDSEVGSDAETGAPAACAAVAISVATAVDGMLTAPPAADGEAADAAPADVPAAPAAIAAAGEKANAVQEEPAAAATPTDGEAAIARAAVTGAARDPVAKNAAAASTGETAAALEGGAAEDALPAGGTTRGAAAERVAPRAPLVGPRLADRLAADPPPGKPAAVVDTAMARTTADAGAGAQATARIAAVAAGEAGETAAREAAPALPAPAREDTDAGTRPQAHEPGAGTDAGEHGGTARRAAPAETAGGRSTAGEAGDKTTTRQPPASARGEAVSDARAGTAAEPAGTDTISARPPETVAMPAGAAGGAAAVRAAETAAPAEPRTVEVVRSLAPERLPERALLIARDLREDGETVWRATLDLDPPELGRLRVEMRLEDGRVWTRFTVENAAAQERIATQADRLRDALASQGLDDGGVEVMLDQSGLGDARERDTSPDRPRGGQTADEAEHDAAAPRRGSAAAGRLDTWA